MSAVTHRIKVTCCTCAKVTIVRRREGQPMLAASNAITAAKMAHKRVCVPDAQFNVETEVVR